MNSEFWNIFQGNSNGFSDRNCSESGWVPASPSLSKCVREKNIKYFKYLVDPNN
jgi:hypothetical protein